MSKAQLNRVPSTVRAYNDMVVTIESGQPWPGVYRGSKYSIVRQNSDVGLKLNHRDVQLNGTIPTDLHQGLRDVGKSEGSGLGSIRITANRDILTKVHADNYSNVDQALVSEGWIPVYLGKLSGAIDFDGIDNDPDPGNMDPPCVWEGLPFRHGERWTVTANGALEWRISVLGQFNFPSSYQHTGLVRNYKSIRSHGGRLRVNEHGHVWMELPNQNVQNSNDLSETIEEWYHQARENERNQLLNLVHRRLKATGGGNPEEGHFPIYLGHVSQFDNGNVPEPVITDKSYYEAASQHEDN